MGPFRRRVVKKLVKAGDVDGLLALAASEEVKERADAVGSLPFVVDRAGESARRRAIEAARAATADADADVRGQGLFALWEIVGSAATEPLVAALEDRDPGVRLMAAAMLAKGERAEARRALTKSLGDEHGGVRALAAQSLGVLGDPAASDALRRVASQDPDPEVRKEAKVAVRLLEQAEPPGTS